VPFVYVLVVLLWILLLAAELVFVVPVAIALAVVTGFGLGVGRFLRDAWRTLTATGVDGPSPVSRPPVGRPDPAYPHYLLVQVWRDALSLNRRTVPWFVAQARWAISTLTETLLPLPRGLALFPLWFGLCAGVVLATVPLSVAALAFGLATVVTAAVGLAGWSVCVLVLGAVERVWMAYRRILIACPHAGCYQRFALPEYSCPRCEERHARLTPNHLGAFRHVCRCGARLPTTILLGRFRLGAYCPHCRRRLPGRIGRARVEPLPFVGGPAAGKTTLMFLAVRALRASAAGARGRAEFVAARDARAYAGAVAELDRGGRLAKTGPELPVATMVDLTLPAAHRILYLFDPAGELHTGATRVERLRYLDHGEALLFVIDPFALPELRLALSADERRLVEEALDLQTATSDEDPSDTLQRLLAELRSRDDQGRQRRIAVVVTKADVLRETTVGGGLDTDPRGWLERLGLGNTIRTLERTAGEVRYFASGLDSSPAALAELLGWVAGLPLGGPVDPAFDDRPAADELRDTGPVAGRPADVVPVGHRVGRHSLFAALAVLGPALMVLFGLWIFTTVH
jgi:Double-GTPase 2